MKFTVIMRNDGIDRTYHCANYYDAIVLRDALETRYNPGTIELWDGMDLLTRRMR
jgi:hypothetical protein